MQNIALSSWRELARSSWEASCRRGESCPSAVLVLTPSSYVGMVLAFAGGDLTVARRFVPREAPGEGFWREVLGRLTAIEEIEAVPFTRVSDASHP